ncbi:MAG: tRNA epoxyqueuosine(34) reductase QueG [Bryobacteraceae bacterium]|nr:tRNA epoxyqueuosine(34) reductase QueG [Bryobacteraceae bacterium]
MRAQALELARDCGFELAGVAPAAPVAETAHFQRWIAAGMAGEMSYIADHRASLRLDPKRLLPSARSLICVGKLYNAPMPYSTRFPARDLAWISRYAWGEDYHRVMRKSLKKLDRRLRETAGVPFESRIAVDTAPLLERSYARLAGLGWIGKNTCLINQREGSWFFLGELLTSLEIEPDAPPPDRCGTCVRCIEACPTQAIVPTGRPDGPQWTLDSRLCISYFTIELRSAIPEEHREAMGRHVFGCDICQDVCPWNRRAPVTADPAFAPARYAPPLETMAALTEAGFRALFRRTPVSRARYRGFLRNVAVAMGNSGLERFRAPLEKLAASPDELIAQHAAWALTRLSALAAVP